MKKTIIFITFFTFFCAGIFAQSAEKVTEMLETDTITLEDIAYFASIYLDLIGDETQDNIALSTLENHVDLSKITNREEGLTYTDFAYFCTQVWNIKGGIMLQITNAPRYAYRELRAKGFIKPEVFPNDHIAGFEALKIMTDCIDYSLAHNTIDLESFAAASTIDFESVISR